MNDYLWDPSRESDPEVKAFEERLAPLRREAPPLPALPDRSERLPLAWRRAFVAAPLLLAASLALAAALAHLSRGGGWEVRWEGDRTTRLARGEWLETGGATVRLAVGRIGTLTLEPGTRVRLLSDSPRDHRVALDRGTVHAVIQAPPRRFFVETPVTTAIDLGCAYSLSTDEAGNGLLRVRAGWVAFERRTARGAEEVVVPAGASCRVSAARGPGLPAWDDAPAAFAASLAALERAPDIPADALDALLREARARDGLTLLALVPRVQTEARAAIRTRLEQLVPALSRLPREPFLAADAAALDEARVALGLPRP